MNDAYENCIKAYETTASADVGGEFVLPDYLPDAKRVLHVFAQVNRSGNYSDASSLSCEGNVTCGAVYAGDDGDLHYVKYSLPFTAKAPARDLPSDFTVITKMMTPDVALRLANPRKFSLKCRLPVGFTVYRTEICDPYIEGVQDESLQYETEENGSYTVSVSSDDSIPVSEDIVIPKNMPEPGSLISLYVIPGMPSASAEDGEVTVKADIGVLILYQATDRTVHMYNSTIPFSRRMTVPQAIPESVCICEISVHDVQYDLTADDGGELRVAEVDFSADLDLTVQTPSRGNYTADIFSTAKECEASYRTVTFRRALPLYSAHFTVSGETAAPGGESVVFATAECGRSALINDENGLLCEGEIRIYAVRGSAGEYESVDFSVPFRIPLQFKVSSDKGEAFAACIPSVPKVRADAEKIYADTELYVAVSFAEEREKKIISSLRITDEPVKKRDCSLILYRPEKGEGRWDVAKKFRVPPDELDSLNEPGQNVLVIPV